MHIDTLNLTKLFKCALFNWKTHLQCNLKVLTIFKCVPLTWTKCLTTQLFQYVYLITLSLREKKVTNARTLQLIIYKVSPLYQSHESDQQSLGHMTTNTKRIHRQRNISLKSFETTNISQTCEHLTQNCVNPYLGI